MSDKRYNPLIGSGEYGSAFDISKFVDDTTASLKAIEADLHALRICFFKPKWKMVDDTTTSFKSIDDKLEYIYKFLTMGTMGSVSFTDNKHTGSKDYKCK